MARIYKIIIPIGMFLALAFSGSRADVVRAGQNIIRSNSFGAEQKKQLNTWIDFDDSDYAAPDRKRSHKRRRKVKPKKETR
ncbi:MAG: hypothetical protein HQ510_08660 [Candidatus Marinimicrobia bacterium]|nr:hypothetical protein [Candidatus Neomarinimicrobiota bacterium]